MIWGSKISPLGYYQCDGAVLECLILQVEQEFFHRQEHAAVIAGRSQHHAVIPERLCHRFRHVAPAQVDDCDLFAQSLQLFCQIRRRFGSVAVNGSVCHQYAFFDFSAGTR